MSKLFEMRKCRQESLDKAEALLAKAESEKRDLSASEKSVFDEHMAEVNRLTVKIEPLEKRSTINQVFGGPLGMLDAGKVPPANENNNHNPVNNGVKAPPVDLTRFYAELGDYMRGDMLLSDTPVYIGTGAGVESVGATVPTQVLAYVAAYYNLDSFALAGARQLNTDNTIPLSMPVVSGGPAASTFAEGSSASQSQPFVMDAFTFKGTKYSRLVKVSEEALMNSAIPLQGAILDELSAGIATTFTAAITAAMLTALTANSGVLVAQGSNDYYKTLGSVLHSIPPRWAAPNNRWMLSRATLAKIKDLRATTSGVPMFDPATSQIFQRDVVINDNLSAGQVVFGNWEGGAIIRKSPFILLPLREAYASSGEIGFKATQFLDQHFLCEFPVTDCPNQPLYYTILS